MKSTLIAAATLATLAVANPLNEKRAYYTTWVEETVTVTVTAGQEPTKAADWNNWVPTKAADTPAVPAQTSWSSWSSASGSGSEYSAGNPGNSGEYGTPILEHHNRHRANHSAPALDWDDELAAIAQQIAETCVYEHNTEMGGGGYGQNIGAGAPGNEIPAMISNQMYNDEIDLYPGYGGEPDMGDFSSWGHFSQIVWKGTTHLGCYTAHCPGGLGNTGGGVSPYFTVCNYKPPGNFGGQYGENVLAPNGDPTLSV